MAKDAIYRDLSDYAGIVRRDWWIVLAAATVGVVAAALFTSAQSKEYESSAKVLVASVDTDANAVAGRTRGDINLDTEAQVVTSAAVAAKARELIGVATPADELRSRVSVEVPPNSTVLVIRFRDRTAAGARAGSDAFARAYLRNRGDTANARLAAQTEALQDQIGGINSQLRALTSRQAALSTNSPERAYLELQKSNLLSQLNDLTLRLTTVTTTTITPGEIISDAQLPRRPIHPSEPINMGSGLILGIVLGLTAAVLRDRLERRVRRASDVDRRGGVPVLMDFSGTVALGQDDPKPAAGTGVQQFRRLRNRVVGALRETTKVVIVSGASPGAASRVVAANLAIASAIIGDRVVLICALGEPTEPVTRMLGVPAAPGLSDVLSGQASLPDATHTAACHPGLRVLPADAGGLYQPDAVRALLGDLRAAADVVIVAAPALSAGADAQTLAAHADLAIMVVELGRTRYVEIRDGAEQLRSVAPGFLGAVTVATHTGRRWLRHLRPHPTTESPARPPADPAATRPAGQTVPAASPLLANGASAAPRTKRGTSQPMTDATSLTLRSLASTRTSTGGRRPGGKRK